MLSFNEFINEAFDSKPAQVKKIDNEKYYFEIEQNKYQVVFTPPDQAHRPTEIDFGTVKKYDGWLNLKMTNTGNQYKVLSTVKSIVQSYVKNVKPAGLIFTANKGTNPQESDARAKVYKRMVKKFLPAAEWSYAEQEDAKKVTFTLMRLK